MFRAYFVIDIITTKTTYVVGKVDHVYIINESVRGAIS